MVYVISCNRIVLGFIILLVYSNERARAVVLLNYTVIRCHIDSMRLRLVFVRRIESKLFGCIFIDLDLLRHQDLLKSHFKEPNSAYQVD